MSGSGSPQFQAFNNALNELQQFGAWISANAPEMKNEWNHLIATGNDIHNNWNARQGQARSFIQAVQNFAQSSGAPIGGHGQSTIDSTITSVGNQAVQAGYQASNTAGQFWQHDVAQPFQRNVMGPLEKDLQNIGDQTKDLLEDAAIIAVGLLALWVVISAVRDK